MKFRPLKSCAARLTALWLALLSASFETPAANPRVQEVVVVFKTHFDIGYTDLVTNVLTRYRTTFLDGALKLIDNSSNLPVDQRFVWTVPGWPLHQMLWPGQTPERREKVLQALKAGRLAVHAMPFTLQTESLDLEDLVRGLKFSADLARENGLPLPTAAKMTDVPEHTWVLPVLLKHAGINFLHIGCNGGSTPMHVPPLFWWQGPDGSRLLTSYSDRYGTGIIPPDDWPYHTWLAMIMTGDNHGPPSAAEVDNLLKQAASELPGVKLKFGKLEDFYQAIMAEKNQNIPTVRGDMPDTWIHGFEAMPRETKLAWDVRPLEAALAALDTQLRAEGLNPPSLEQLPKAYEESLLYSEHTFGFFGKQSGGFRYGDDWKKARAEGKYARFEQSFEDKRDYIRATAAIVTNALNQHLNLLVQQLDAEGPRIVVFNPLPWKRSGAVDLQAPGCDGFAVQDAASRGAVQPLDVDGRNLHFFAGDVPAGGYKTYRLVKATPANKIAPATGPRLTEFKNKFFRLQIDAARGGMVSLVDLKSGRELIAASDEGGASQYLHERFSSNNVQEFMKAYCRGSGWVTNDFGKPGMPGPEQAPYARLALTNWSVSLSEDAYAKSITLRCANAAPLARSVSLKYTLYEQQPFLDLEWEIQDKTPDTLPEGGWLYLPFAIDQPRFKLARLGSIIDPATDIIEGANRHLFCLNSGMTITGRDGFGVGLCPLDSPLVSLDEPGLWKFSRQFIPRRARVYVNLYNNQWDTNFPLWQDGSWLSRIRIWTIRNGDLADNLIEPAWEARLPLLAAFADGSKGTLPLTSSGLKVSRHGVIATFFGPASGSGWTPTPPRSSADVLLRLWELAGTGGSLTVTLPEHLNAVTAVPVNLRGEPEGKPLKIKHGTFKIDLPAFAPASFILESPASSNSHFGMVGTTSTSSAFSRRFWDDVEVVPTVGTVTAIELPARN